MTTIRQLAYLVGDTLLRDDQQQDPHRLSLIEQELTRCADRDWPEGYNRYALSPEQAEHLVLALTPMWPSEGTPTTADTIKTRSRGRSCTPATTTSSSSTAQPAAQTG